jgi:cytochrome P450
LVLALDQEQTLTATVPTAARQIPEDIGRAVILPESYGDPFGIAFPALKWLRAYNPLAVAHIEGFDPMRIVTRYEDLLAIEKQPEIFISGGDQSVILNSQAGDEVIKGMTGGSVRSLDAPPFMDAPEHTMIRRTWNPWFRPVNVRRFEDRVRALAKREVDRLFAEHNGVCDFATDFGLLYPLRVILTLLGLPPEDEPIIMKLTQELFGAQDPDNQRTEVMVSPDAAAQSWMTAVGDFAGYLQGRIVEARANPTEDLIGVLATAKVDDEYLHAGYLLGQFVSIATAGHDTTSATLNGTLLAFIENPAQLDYARAHPEGIERLVEEAIRYVSPVRHFMRTAVADTVVNGEPIQQGERLFLSFPSANRDEGRFGPTVDSFDITVERPKHAGFGHGPHQCQGMMIARLELKILFEELLPRLKSMELIGAPKYTKTNFVGGIKSLPVRISGS